MIAIQDPCVLWAALRGDIRNGSKCSSLNSQIKVWLNILICDVWYTVTCSQLFMMVPDQNTSTTWKGWTCLWWHQAKAGQSSLGPWICGRHRLEGCHSLSLAHGSMVWRYHIPPLKHSSLQPPQSLNRKTAGWDEEEYEEKCWSENIMCSHIGLTEAHEDERSRQHDGSLGSICVNDCSQTPWGTTHNRHTEQEISCSLMFKRLGFLCKRSPATV